MSVCLSSHLSVYLSVCLSASSILWDVLNFWTWQGQKRQSTARLLQCFKLTTSKTKQFCETSFIYLKYCACQENWCQVIQRAAPVTQNHLCKPDDLMLQNATPLRKSAPWPPNISDEHVSCTAPATENASFQILFKCPTPAIVLGNATKNLTFYSLSARYRIPCACHAKPHLNVQKWTVRPSVFNAVDFEMCFAPQRALFRHLNFEKCSEAEVLCTCWLRNVLRATTACTFWASQLPKLLWTRCALYMLTSKCASRHNSMHFLSISTQLPKLLWTRCALYILTSKCASRHNGVHFFNMSTSKKCSEPVSF